jgi:hypothetical protein
LPGYFRALETLSGKARMLLDALYDAAKEGKDLPSPEGRVAKPE